MISFLKKKDLKIWNLAKKVNLIYDEELDKYFPKIMPTMVEVFTRDGKIFNEKVDYAKGTPENPMTNEEIRKKFMRIATITVEEDVAKAIINKVNRLEAIEDINELTRILRFKQ